MDRCACVQLWLHLFARDPWRCALETANALRRPASKRLMHDHVRTGVGFTVGLSRPSQP